MHEDAEREERLRIRSVVQEEFKKRRISTGESSGFVQPIKRSKEDSSNFLK